MRALFRRRVENDMKSTSKSVIFNYECIEEDRRTSKSFSKELSTPQKVAGWMWKIWDFLYNTLTIYTSFVLPFFAYNYTLRFDKCIQGKTERYAIKSLKRLFPKTATYICRLWRELSRKYLPRSFQNIIQMEQ